MVAPKAKIWLRRDKYWVPTVTVGPGQRKYIQLTNIVDRKVIVHPGSPLGWWMAADMIPRSPGYVSVGSRRYNEWQTLAYEATTDREEEQPVEVTGPLVDHPPYDIPVRISARPKKEPEESREDTSRSSDAETEESNVRDKGCDDDPCRMADRRATAVWLAVTTIRGIEGVEGERYHLTESEEISKTNAIEGIDWGSFPAMQSL